MKNEGRKAQREGRSASSRTSDKVRLCQETPLLRIVFKELVLGSFGLGQAEVRTVR
jgi:hypothetical protein